MNLVRLAIQGQQSLNGTFDYSAALVGDAVLYNVNQSGKPLGPIQTAIVPDAGDAAPPGIEVQDDSLLGVTSAGRPVMAFRSGNRKPNSTEWDGTSSLYIGVGAASNLRPSAQTIVVQTTQPGPQGPKGDKGDTGAQGASGAPGAPGQGAQVSEDQIQRIAALSAEKVANYPAAGDHFGITPTEAQSGLWMQDAITVLLSNQAVWQRIVMAIDESVLNLVAAGYQPKAS